INWRVEKLIPERGVVILGGASGSFKTMGAMTMAVKIVDGSPWMDKFATNPCPVLYIDEENGDIVLPNRFDRILRGMKVEPPNNLFVCNFQNIKLDTEPGARLLSELISFTGAKVVFIDSLVRCMEGEEDKAINVRNIFDFIKKYVLSKVSDVVFVILHHTLKDIRGRDLLTTLRGSGDLGAFCDTVLMFKRKENPEKSIFSVDIAKNRHIDLNELPGFEIEVVDNLDKSISFRFTDFKSSENITEKMVKALKEYIETEEKTTFTTSDFKQAVTGVSQSRTSLYRAIEKLENEGLIQKEGKGKYSLIEDVQTEII
ncbi:MAG: AAA family ATPase, partial [Candidatus Bathyarchaeota archaeon]|nr:AAA family ATPase [Candidatus Bathyarchaeota archaeon]